MAILYCIQWKIQVHISNTVFHKMHHTISSLLNVDDGTHFL